MSIKFTPDTTITSEEKPHCYFDVDNTLVRPVEEEEEADVYINNVAFVVNYDLVREVEVARARGHVVIIWSQGGSDWAATVVEKLELTSSVDFILAKPSWFADDKPANEILDASRRFYRPF